MSLVDLLGAARGDWQIGYHWVSVYSRAGVARSKSCRVPLQYRGGGQIDPRPNLQSDRRRQLGERGCDREARVRVDSELVVAAAMVLHECERGDDHSSPAVGSWHSHGSQSVFGWAVVGLYPVVLILLDMVPGRWHQLVEHPAYLGALWVTTSDGVTFDVAKARMKDRWAACASRRLATKGQ